MAQEERQCGEPGEEQIRKGCQISLMFPVETDEEALAVKKLIDAAVPDVKNKRYTFQITEM